MPNKKTKRVILSFLLVILMAIPFGSVLAESISGNNIIVESGKTLEKTSFLSGENVRVDGDINGTTFITAGNIEVNGTIDGDLFIAGQSVTINGSVKGSVFTAGQDITINGAVENSIYLAGATLKVNSQIKASAFVAGQTIYIEDDAVIEREAFVGGSTIFQNGVVNGDWSSSSDALSIGGKIGGDLNYSSKNKAEVLNGSEVVGETTWKKIDNEPSKVTKTMFTTTLLIRILFSIAASLVIWFFVKWIRPDFWPNLAEEIALSPIRTLGFGALAVVLIPIFSILLIITIIGIPLSFILLSLYGLVLSISKIILSVCIGVWLQKRFSWSGAQAFWLFLLVLVVLSILGMVPLVGWIISLFIAFFGMGSVVLTLFGERIHT